MNKLWQRFLDWLLDKSPEPDFPYIDNSGNWKVIGENVDGSIFDTVHINISDTIAQAIASQANFEGIHHPIVYKAVEQ